MRIGTLSIAVSLALAVAMTGCQTSGTGVGTERNGNTQVNFNWQSTDSVSGNMTATFSDGRTFTGRYFQITSSTQVDTLGPLWDGWSLRRFRGWPYWYGEPGPQFITQYSGRVLANLSAAQGNNPGDHLRCRFQLVHPQSGMAGGGQGTCQFSGGNTIDATFNGNGR